MGHAFTSWEHFSHMHKCPQGTHAMMIGLFMQTQHILPSLDDWYSQLGVFSAGLGACLFSGARCTLALGFAAGWEADWGFRCNCATG